MSSRSVLLFVVAVSTSIYNVLAASKATWKTHTLRDPKSANGLSEKAVAVAKERSGNFIVAVDRSSALSTTSTPMLYKTSLDGTLLWARESILIKGTAFAVAVDENIGSAYLIVSSPPGFKSPHANGHVARFSGISSNATADNVYAEVSEEEIFSTNSANGHSKFFGCVLDPASGDLFLTGGSSDSLYGPSNGNSDVIVVRISSTGEVMATAQLGTRDDEFGRAIAVSNDSSVVAVAVHKVTESGGQESVLYRLDAKTLEDTEGPRSLLSFGTTPLFTPFDVAISGPTLRENDTRTTVVCGSAITIPNRRADLFFHVYAKIRGSDSDVAVYMDGASDQRRDDYAVGVSAGEDGNLYSIGYSNPLNPSDSTALSLTVISPTGKRVYKSGFDGTFGDHSPTSMTLVMDDGKITVVFVGYSSIGNSKKPFFGVVAAPQDEIPAFQGFGSVVQGAGTNSTDKQKEEPDAGSKPSVVIIIACVAGGLVALLFFGLVGYTIFMKRRRVSNNANIQRDFVTSDNENQNDPSSSSQEQVVFEARSVLV